MPSNSPLPGVEGAIALAAAPSPRRPSHLHSILSRRSNAQRAALATDALMAAPSLLLVGMFVLIPIVIALYLSFTNWDGFTFPPKLVGLKNYSQLFRDPEVLQAAKLTAGITLVGTVLCNVLGLGVAVLVNGRGRFKALMRVLVFYPYVIGAVIIGFLWSSILGTNGAVNSLLANAGVDGLPFLSSPGWALGSIIVVVVWSGFGINVVLYLAGLQTIPDSLIEAATIDGATPWQTFWKVKLPLLAPTVTVNVVLVAIGLLRVYEVILALTAGGPAGTTESVVFHILSTSFSKSQLGYGAAQSVVLMIVIVALTISLTMFRRRSEEAVSA